MLSLFYPVLMSASAQGGGSLLGWLLSTNVVNILLVALILGFIVRKLRLFKGFSEQRERVAQEIASAQARKQTALEALERTRNRAQTLQADIDAILAQAQAAAESMSSQILADAQAEAQKIVDAARARVEVEQKNAAQALQARLLREAVAQARQELSRLPQDERARAIDDFIEALPAARRPQEAARG